MKIKCFVRKRLRFQFNSDYIPRKGEQVIHEGKGWMVGVVSHNLDEKHVMLGLECSVHLYEKEGEPGQFGQRMKCSICDAIYHDNFRNINTSSSTLQYTTIPIRIPEGK